MKTETRDLFKGLAFISPWLIGFMVFTALPIVLSFYFSLTDYSLLKGPLFIGLANYRDLLGDPVFRHSLWISLIYAALALPLGLFIALGVAMLLNAPIRGKSIYRTIVFLPSLVPAVASAMLWMWLFNTKLGLINLSISAVPGVAWVALLALVVIVLAGLVLMYSERRSAGKPLLVASPLLAIVFAFGVALLATRGTDTGVWNWYFAGPGWLTEPSWALPAIVLMSFWGVGNTVVIFLAGLQDVPRELYEAADIDGAGVMRQVFSVTLPMLSPVIFFNLIMAIIGSLSLFVGPLILTGGGPARATYFYTLNLYDNGFNFLKMGYASAMAWVQLLIVLFLTLVAFWTSKHWVHYQGK
ncbi:MAG: sugar ABC transporter permease [Tepidisphaeraceae bacterium]